MPMPESTTSIHTESPSPSPLRRTRARTDTPPRAVYLSALSSRFDSMRCSSRGSLRTHRPLARSRSCSWRCSACAENMGLSARNRPSSETGSSTGSTTPASRRETSSMVSSELPSAFTARISRCALRLPGCSFSSAAPNSAIACSGWRRSWLAVARKRVFSMLARSAAAICSPRRVASASFSKRSTSESVSSRCCCRPTRSVNSR